MTIWLDAQLSPKIADWISKTFGVDCVAIRDIGLTRAKDKEIFKAALDKRVVMMTKDSDFVRLQDNSSDSPSVIWLTCGNTSNEKLKTILLKTLPKALELLSKGERLTEIGG